MDISRVVVCNDAQLGLCPNVSHPAVAAVRSCNNDEHCVLQFIKTKVLLTFSYNDIVSTTFERLLVIPFSTIWIGVRGARRERRSWLRTGWRWRAKAEKQQGFLKGRRGREVGEGAADGVNSGRRLGGEDWDIVGSGCSVLGLGHCGEKDEC